MTEYERKELAQKLLGKTVDIVIDRPIGYVHKTNSNSIVYPINYGYIPDIIGGDDEEIDVYLLGVNVPVRDFVAKIIGVVYRKNDNEDKLIAAPEDMTFSKEKIEKTIKFQEQFFDTTIVTIYD